MILSHQSHGLILKSSEPVELKTWKLKLGCCLEIAILATMSKMIFDLIVPRNEGSGGYNVILGVGSKVWE